MDAKRIRHRLEYAFFLSVIFVLRSVPVEFSVRFAKAIAAFMSALPRRWTRYDVAAANVRTALGPDTSDQQVAQTIRMMWEHLARMVVEIIQLERRMTLENCADFVRFQGSGPCVEAVLSDRPVLMLGGHFGNWEISVNTFGHFGFPMGVVARDLDNPWLHRWFLKFRESTGNSMISKSGASTELIQVMESGRNASLLCDQDAGRRGVFVDFFGKPASTFKSIALLALQYDALIVVGGAWRLPENEQRNSRWVNFELTTEAVLDSRNYTDSDAVTQITADYTKALERLIQKAASQYFWVHRRWKSEPRIRNRKTAV